MWIYSTVLLQFAVDARYLGRVFAFEMCAFTVAKGAGAVLGGLVVDYGRIGLPDACFLMFGLSAAVFTVQLTYYVAGGFGGGGAFGGRAAAAARRRAGCGGARRARAQGEVTTIGAATARRRVGRASPNPPLIGA